MPLGKCTFADLKKTYKEVLQNKKLRLSKLPKETVDNQKFWQ